MTTQLRYPTQTEWDRLQLMMEAINNITEAQWESDQIDTELEAVIEELDNVREDIRKDDEFLQHDMDQAMEGLEALKQEAAEASTKMTEEAYNELYDQLSNFEGQQQGWCDSMGGYDTLYTNETAAIHGFITGGWREGTSADLGVFTKLGHTIGSLAGITLTDNEATETCLVCLSAWGELGEFGWGYTGFRREDITTANPWFENQEVAEQLVDAAQA